MAIDRTLVMGSAAMLVLKLLENQDMYGYQMIEELDRRSDHTFELKTGTLYPLLHSLEEKGLVSAYEQTTENQRPRRYYHLEPAGAKLLAEKQAEWESYSRAVGRVLKGGPACDCIG